MLVSSALSDFYDCTVITYRGGHWTDLYVIVP